MNLPTKTVTIPSGQSSSEALDCGGGNLISIIFPAAMTAAALKVQVSFNSGSTWNDLYGSGGALFEIWPAANGCVGGFDAVLYAGQLIRFVSLDSSNSVVTEAADRVLTLVFRGK